MIFKHKYLFSLYINNLIKYVLKPTLCSFDKNNTVKKSRACLLPMIINRWINRNRLNYYNNINVYVNEYLFNTLYASDYASLYYKYKNVTYGDLLGDLLLDIPDDKIINIIDVFINIFFTMSYPDCHCYKDNVFVITNNKYNELVCISNRIFNNHKYYKDCKIIDEFIVEYFYYENNNLIKLFSVLDSKITYINPILL